jgi:hypothetical protein
VTIDGQHVALKGKNGSIAELHGSSMGRSAARRRRTEGQPARVLTNEGKYRAMTGTMRAC